MSEEGTENVDGKAQEKLKSEMEKEVGREYECPYEEDLVRTKGVQKATRDKNACLRETQAQTPNLRSKPRSAYGCTWTTRMDRQERDSERRGLRRTTMSAIVQNALEGKGR